ncbi:MAG: CTP synthase [Patescibacteria group bacterium]|nr:CTP synthase [Patescibacteria group bacterium]MDE1940704.1 CTP synthase [Patescibacteria group bacterium]MDE1966956.1 CTP synthase [Patescibacteria group bacterium]
MKKRPIAKKRSISKPRPRLKPKPKLKHKFIFVIGGVMSGVGKGIATSSIGMLLSAKGFKVNLVKVDPYLNVDAGTMNPTEHGEVFVLNSGLETDQDMGNYERFLGRDLTNADYMTSGMVYKTVIDKERSLQYGGKFVDADHVREEIVERIEQSVKANRSDITVVEIGGTIGDYQNVMFYEAARVIKIRHPHDVMFILVSYLPVPGTIGEMKSKPTQNAVKQLNGYGIHADMIIARGPLPIDHKRKEKIAFTCNIDPRHVISAPDIKSVYDVPVNFKHDRLGEIILETLGLPERQPDESFMAWAKMARNIKNHTKNAVNIAIVGKYFNTGDFVLSDAYISVIEAIKFSGCANGVKPIIHTVNSRDFEKGDPDYSVLDKLDGIIVPGGFGESGIEGKLNVIRYARESGIPYFGLCYGMQLMTIEFARNVLGLEDAHTAEVDPRAKDLVIDIMPDQKKKIAEGNYGGSMRLGLYPSKLSKGTVAAEAYGKTSIKERHRHRYEVNPKYIKRLEAAGLVFSGRSPDGQLMEIAELPKPGTGAPHEHPFFLGTQFHPEFLARPLSPHPLFTAFMKAAKDRSAAQADLRLSEDGRLVESEERGILAPGPIPEISA